MRWIEATNKYMRLKTAARKIAADIGGCAYFVGSALTSETRPRDVDVRIVLSDEAFEARYKLSVYDWQWQARLCEWSTERWNWHHECERFGIMVAGACGERTIDLSILPDTLWQAVYAQAPYEQWGAWKPEPETILAVLKENSVKGTSPFTRWQLTGWDWYFFWTGGPIRRAIYEPTKRFIRFIENLPI